MYSNTLKDDALNSGLTFWILETDIYKVKDKTSYNFAFDAMVTRETGRVELIHLKELDLPQTNLEFGQNIKSTPVYGVWCFSIIWWFTGKQHHEVRKGAPSMTGLYWWNSFSLGCEVSRNAVCQ